MAKKFLYVLGGILFSFSAIAQPQQGMGVGNNNPQEMLDVTGAIKIGTTTNTNTGTIRWNGTNFQGYNGTIWVDLDSQGGADTDWTVSGVNQYSAVSGNVGIGTTSPATKLDVNGQIRMSTGATVGYVPVSDANGVMTWTDPNTVVTPTTTNTLDAAYDQGGAGAGREIDAIDGTVAITGEDGFMVSGSSYNSGLAVGAAGGIADGAGIRMFFNPKKAAFRAGWVTGTEWNDANIGGVSVALGHNTTASGSFSTAIGSGSTASGSNSVAIGINNIAGGDYSFAAGNGNTTGPSSAFYAIALGGNNTASGQWATAIGGNNVASGMGATALGLNSTAPSMGETVMGLFSTNYTATSAFSWNPADRLFVVGNGTSASALSNALTIYKDGTMNINDAYDMPNADGTSGQVLTTNGSGVAVWQNPSVGSSLADSDNDTKIQVEETADEDMIRFDTGGSQRMIIDNNGNVGLGTNSPVNLLHVQNNVSGLNFPVFLRNSSISNGDGAGIGFLSEPNGNWTKAGIYYERTAGFGVGKLHLLVDDGADNQSVTLSESRLTVNSNGNVGIGTSSPTAKLDIAGTVAMNDNQIRLRGGSDGNHFLSYIGGSFDGAKLTGYNNVILNTVTGGDALIVTGNRVGIGTTSPIAPLHVESTSTASYGNFWYYSGGGFAGGACCGGTIAGVAIHANGRVMAGEFDAFSDARIKNVIGLSNTEDDLQRLLGIQITDYRMKDKAKDIKPYKKVIAQQVEEVYPEAVSTITDVVPNIYAVSTIEDGYIALPNELKKGDRVKLIFNEGAEMVTVLEADLNGFRVDLNRTDDVFVYGQEVDDFRTVDYEAIAMLNVSATQELFKLITKLQSDNQELKDKLHDYSSLRSDVQLLKEAMGIDMQSAK